jgi:hypothetical protein
MELICIRVSVSRPCYAYRAPFLSLYLLLGPLDRWQRWQIPSGELLVQTSRPGERRRPTGHLDPRTPCHACLCCTLASEQGQEVLRQLEIRTHSLLISSSLVPTYRSGASTLTGHCSFPAELDGLTCILRSAGPNAGGVCGLS